MAESPHSNPVYAVEAAAVEAAAFLGVFSFLGAAAFLVVAAFLAAGLVVFATRPDLVLVRVAGLSTTAGAAACYCLSVGRVHLSRWLVGSGTHISLLLGRSLLGGGGGSGLLGSGLLGGSTLLLGGGLLGRCLLGGLLLLSGRLLLLGSRLLLDGGGLLGQLGTTRCT